MSTALPTLDDLARDPRSAAGLPKAVLSGLLLRISVAQSAIVAQLAVADASQLATPQSSLPPRLLTAKEMAAHLNVPESKVRADARAGRIPCVMVGRYMRFRPDEVERAIQSGS